jgi:hypothetical protein
MVIEDSVSSISLKEQVNDYLMSLHDNGDDTKHNYAIYFGTFIDFLEKNGIKHFQDASKTDLGKFLSTKRKQGTKNLYIFIIKNFYKNYLEKPELVKHLHQKATMEEITPSELLTPDEVMLLAAEI